MRRRKNPKMPMPFPPPNFFHTSSRTTSLNSLSTFWPVSSVVDSPCRFKRAPRSNLGCFNNLTFRTWTYPAGQHYN
jgi:hypothetical protein